MRRSMIRNRQHCWIALLLVAGFVCLARYAIDQNSIENRIIRAIDQQCKAQGECTISLSEIANFEWDTVYVFIAGDLAQIRDILGMRDRMNMDLQDGGIAFGYNGKVVKMHMTAYDYFRDESPRLSYWIERGSSDLYYRTYARDNAILHAEKIKLDNGSYRYVLFGE